MGLRQQRLLPTISVCSTSFNDTFDRADGTPGNGWYSPGGGTIAIVSNKLVITPTKGVELLTNGDFSAWTGDNPDNWTVDFESAPNDEISEVGSGEGHGGSGTGLCNIYSSANLTRPKISQNKLTQWRWHHVQLLIDTLLSGRLRITNNDGSIQRDKSDTGNFIVTGRSDAENSKFLIYTAELPADITIDNVSVKQLELATLFALRNHAFSNACAQAAITRIETTQPGIVHYADADNFVLAYLEEATLGGDRVKLVKRVEGAYTEIASADITYGAGQALKLSRSGTNYTVDYNGAEAVSATTITDGVFASAKTWGLFSTHNANTFDDYEWRVN
jgi:YD repeat-containing protein